MSAIAEALRSYQKGIASLTVGLLHNENISTRASAKASKAAEWLRGILDCWCMKWLIRCLAGPHLWSIYVMLSGSTAPLGGQHSP